MILLAEICESAGRHDSDGAQLNQSYIDRLLPTGDPSAPGHLHLIHLRVLCFFGLEGLRHRLIGDLQVIGFVDLAAEAFGQGLQRGQVLHLQVMRSHVAVLDGLALELVEEVLEDIVDADSGKDAALLDGFVQAFWNVLLIAEEVDE